MKKINNLSIKLKLLATILIVTLVPLMTAGYIAFQISYNAIYNETKHDLEYIAHLEGHILSRHTSDKNISPQENEGILQELAEIKKTFYEQNGMSGYGYIIDETGKMMYHPNEKTVGSDISKEAFIQTILSKKSGYVEYEWEGKMKVAAFQELPNGWIYATSTYLDELLEVVNPIKKYVFITSILGSILAIGVGAFIVSKITKPIMSVVAAMKNAESGDLTRQVPIYSEDEVGQISIMYNKMMNRLKTILISIHDASQQVAASSQQLTASADENTRASEQIATAAEEISKGSQEQVEKVASVVQSIHTISTAINDTAQNVAKVNEDSNIATQYSIEGVQNLNKVVEEMNDITKKVRNTEKVIRELGKQSASIMGIITTIRDISEQTNLLALNAAIEAARAGEQGKSFAVVAGEVRKLAEQSGKSAQDIASLITMINDEIIQATKMMEESSQAVSEGEEVVLSASESFKKIEKAVHDVSIEMRSLKKSIDEIQANSQVIVNSSDVISNLAEIAAGDTEEVAAAAEEQMATMQEINASSHMLAKMAEKLQSEVNQFKLK
ncbi:methyl-accepting chemotaxis protein [Peribacillus tepidiphilus]|uniref:methyl-accepting chemotaxis protein n=1 Tax=Peribacillus tepidiphilus TaxID=2652445 RepID=UPI0012926182|nr:methyl-accepting chemotaxis protein [Peribacillus tepidiphilus]